MTLKNIQKTAAKFEIVSVDPKVETHLCLVDGLVPLKLALKFQDMCARWNLDLK